MTRKEAAMKLSFHLMQCGMLMPIGWVDKNGKGSELFEAFKMAQDALREQPRWISVEERLPEKQVSSYIVYGEEGFVGEAVWDGLTFHWVDNENLAFATHWMPLPEPPEVEV